MTTARATAAAYCEFISDTYPVIDTSGDCQTVPSYRVEEVGGIELVAATNPSYVPATADSVIDSKCVVTCDTNDVFNAYIVQPMRGFAAWPRCAPLTASAG
jgi:hypothetical protein